MWIFLSFSLYQRHFQYYDRDNSGDMDIFELREALKGLSKYYMSCCVRSTAFWEKVQFTIVSEEVVVRGPGCMNRADPVKWAFPYANMECHWKLFRKQTNKFVNNRISVSMPTDFVLSNRALETVVLRYHNKRGVINFDMFVQINVRLILVFGK